MNTINQKNLNRQSARNRRSVHRRSLSRIAAVCLLLASFSCLFLTGCRKGPDHGDLSSEIQSKLDSRFQPGLFKITYMTRNGSYPFSDEDGSSRLLVYFKARVEFLQDYSLSEWDKLNASTLATVLGASRHGITGIDPKGNKKGDLLRIYGTSTYQDKAGKWVPSNRIAPKMVKQEEKPFFDQKTELDETMAELSGRVTELKKDNKPVHLSTLESELTRALKKINLKLDRLDKRISLTTGFPSGEYFAIGKGLEKMFKQNNRPFRSYPSSGSIENCRLVQHQEANFGISQNDVAWMALNGEGQDLFEEPYPMKSLRAVCALYPEAIQIITLKSSSLRTIQDLKGKRVNISVKGSGTRVNALQILGAYGFSTDDFAELTELNTTQAIAALKSGKIDALFLTWALPDRSIERLASEQPLHFIPIELGMQKQLSERMPYLFEFVIPRNTYLGLDQDVPTMGMTAMLITHGDTPDEQVKIVLDTLFENLEGISEESIQANSISRKTATQGISIPLHKRARLYFEEGSP